jgi:hypothetical protein
VTFGLATTALAFLCVSICFTAVALAKASSMSPARHSHAHGEMPVSDFDDLADFDKPLRSYRFWGAALSSLSAVFLFSSFIYWGVEQPNVDAPLIPGSSFPMQKDYQELDQGFILMVVLGAQSLVSVVLTSLWARPRRSPRGDRIPLVDNHNIMS